jgi:hypothetical protein
MSEHFSRNTVSTAEHFINAARVPESLKPQAFGPWVIKRMAPNPAKVSAFAVLSFQLQVGFPSQTLLLRHSWATLHRADGEIVMEDSRRELQKHLPIWMKAKGRVLVTGLGLGCVVRGLLANRDVEHITVVEIDKQILRVVGHEFSSNPRVRLIHGDALTIPLCERFDFAWHDLWTDGDTHLQILHAKLFDRCRDKVEIQGAWQFPRHLKRGMPEWILR